MTAREPDASTAAPRRSRRHGWISPLQLTAAFIAALLAWPALRTAWDLRALGAARTEWDLVAWADGVAHPARARRALIERCAALPCPAGDEAYARVRAARGLLALEVRQGLPPLGPLLEERLAATPPDASRARALLAWLLLDATGDRAHLERFVEHLPALDDAFVVDTVGQDVGWFSVEAVRDLRAAEGDVALAERLRAAHRGLRYDGLVRGWRRASAEALPPPTAPG